MGGARAWGEDLQHSPKFPLYEKKLLNDWTSCTLGDSFMVLYDYLTSCEWPLNTWFTVCELYYLFQALKSKESLKPKL